MNLPITTFQCTVPLLLWTRCWSVCLFKDRRCRDVFSLLVLPVGYCMMAGMFLSSSWADEPKVVSGAAQASYNQAIHKEPGSIAPGRDVRNSGMARSNLPAWVALSKQKVHSRTGPGKQHPIRFVYETIFLPFRVVAFKDGWYRVEDYQGDKSWIMAAMVTSKANTFLVTAPCPFYKKDTSPKPYAMLAEGCILKMRTCKSGRCEGVIRTFEGWIDPTLCGWGALPTPVPAAP